jgi:hypothetical protein
MRNHDSPSDSLSTQVACAGENSHPDGTGAGGAKDGPAQSAAQRGEETEPCETPAPELLPVPGISRRQRALPYVVAALLFGFGAYQSVLYFGHKAVPNPDFPAFLQVGHELLSLQMPSSFKRAPVLGLLQVGLSHFVGGPHPELTAGWLLNAILHPFSVVLLWLIARRLVGRSAWWIALIAALNPWWLQNVREPIAETTLHFFIVAAFYCIFTKSRWRYVVASVAAMVRYDAAALILVAFVLDLAQSTTVKQRIRALVFSTAAGVPLGLWLLGTALNFRSEGTTHYLNEMGANGPFWSTLGSYLAGVWTVVVSPLFRVPSGLSGSAATVFSTGAGIPIFVGFCVGVLQALAERRWEVLGLLIFLLAYLVVHSLHSFVLARFCSTLPWIVLLVAAYGLRSLWLTIRTRIPLSARPMTVLSGALAVLIGLWAIDVASVLPDLGAYSVRSVTVPYVALALVCLLLTAEWLCLPERQPIRDVLVLISLSLVILSNQGKLVRMMGSGRQDIEFRLLADWYRHQAGPQDKLATTYAGVVGLYLPNHRAHLLHTAELKADDPAGFLRNCRRKGVTYIAWDSRLGRHPGDRYYEYYGLANLAPLAEPESSGPYEFIVQFQVSEERWINVFHLRASDDP